VVCDGFAVGDAEAAPTLALFGLEAAEVVEERDRGGGLLGEGG
jgi:hypothetical protein